MRVASQYTLEHRAARVALCLPARRDASRPGAATFRRHGDICRSASARLGVSRGPRLRDHRTYSSLDDRGVRHRFHHGHPALLRDSSSHLPEHLLPNQGDPDRGQRHQCCVLSSLRESRRSDLGLQTKPPASRARRGRRILARVGECHRDGPHGRLQLVRL